LSFHLPEPLGSILAQVSRSFGLSLAVLPAALRQPLALAYLLARAADSIADTRLLPRVARLDGLARFQAALGGTPWAGVEPAPAAGGQHPAEQALLGCLPECFALLARQPEEDRARITRLLCTLVHGMRLDLQRFPGDPLVALESEADLEEYTYYAAGCVGEFWTEMAVAHLPALRDWELDPMRSLGRRFGQGLQMTNVLRDVALDLRLGRCYLPREELRRLGLAPEELLAPAGLARLRPLLERLLDRALALHADGWTYLRSIPRSQVRLRLACAWPLLIGLLTLARIRRASDLLDPEVRVKISRPAVYGVLLCSTLLAPWDSLLGRYYARLRRRALAPAAAFVIVP
jgi:farnesyl-diphosphate farnesyltransferase